ncbi:hypothetical protein MKX01_030860 [Papaver californicum]|nr:hypothetical protein MKX01_030860 [Papaver californicum]
MVFRKEIQMSGLIFVFLFLVLGVVSTDGIRGLSTVDKIDGNGGSSTLEKCNFPAVFDIGDSNSDTGGMSAALYAIGTPNGETFFGKPSGRACDGPEELGLGYLRAYLDSLGLSSFKNGANFATGGSSIIKPGYSPFHLDVQSSQFRQFKARVIDIVNTTQQEKGKAELPKPEDFSKALYTFDIGQNDLQVGLSTSESEARASIPNILDQFSTAVQQLYNEGARMFWVHNTGPIGCLPSNNKNYGKEPLDKNGCVIPLNEIAREFNVQLKSKLAQLKANLTGAAFTYVDAYAAKYNLINSAKDQGIFLMMIACFVDPLDFCCCNRRVVVNGMVYGGPCAHPMKHISWDSIHYSEAVRPIDSIQSSLPCLMML